MRIFKKTAGKIIDIEALRLGKFQVLVLLLFLLSAALTRGFYAASCRDDTLVSDMRDYDRAASNFINGNGLIVSPERKAFRPPLYPLFVAAVYAFEPSLGAVRYVQSMIGALTCGLVYVLSLIIGRRLAAGYSAKWRKFILTDIAPLCAALSVILLASQIFYAGVLLSESLFSFFLLVWVVILLLPPRGAGRLYCFVSGGWLGLMALLRPGSLVFLPLLLLSPVYLMKIRGKRKIGLCMTFSIMGAVAVISPWTARNMFVLDSFVPLVTNGGWNFFKGHNPNYNPNYGKSVLPKKIDLKETDLQRYYYRAGFEYLVHHPKMELKNAFRKIISLYDFNKQPWPMSRGRAFNVPYPTLKWGPSILFLALVGLTGFRKYPAFRFILMNIVILHTVLCVIFFGNARFRAPLEPLLFMSACYGLFFLIHYIFTFYGNFRTRQNEPTCQAV